MTRTRKPPVSRKKPKQVAPLWFIAGGGLLLILAGILWANQSQRSAAPSPTVYVGDTAEIPRVKLAEAKAAWDASTAVFVDVRSAEAYALSHIRGALSLPLNEIEQRLNELNPATWIITYCT